MGLTSPDVLSGNAFDSASLCTPGSINAKAKLTNSA